MLYDRERCVSIIHTWAKTRCEPVGECHVRKLYTDFCQWVVSERGRAMRRLPGLPVFSQMLVAAGHERVNRGGRIYYAGLALKPAPAAAMPQAHEARDDAAI